MDEQNEPQPEPITVMGRDYHGRTITRGYMVITPSGNLVEFPATSHLKPGFRLATQADIAAAEQRARAGK